MAVAALWAVGVSPSAQQNVDHWVGTWATADVARPQVPPPAPPPPAGQQPAGRGAPPGGPPQFMHFTNQTLREIVHVSIGGSRARLVLTNVFGTTPITVGAAHVALRDKDAAIAAASARPLTFSGRPTITIPAGAVAVSDPVGLGITPLSDLAVDIYLPGSTNAPSPVTMHGTALQTSYVSETGNHAGSSSFPVVATTPNWFLLARVEVAAPPSVGAIVTFGDSITDGARSTANTNNRWPDHLATRLAAASMPMGIVNAGIGGNRVLGEAGYAAGINALARFDRDVLTQPAATHVIVLEGINDIGLARDNPTPTAEDLIAAHKQLIERAHTHGLKILGATLTPVEGAMYFTASGEAKRQALNTWIRTGKAYDGVVDFDRAVRDASQPGRFQPQYDSGDHLHPSDAGYKAMGDAIDLTLFKPVPSTGRTASR